MEVVIPLENTNIVRNKWVFIWKRDSQGKIMGSYLQLVAQGFTQTFRVNYDETYSPVA